MWGAPGTRPGPGVDRSGVSEQARGTPFGLAQLAPEEQAAAPNRDFKYLRFDLPIAPEVRCAATTSAPPRPLASFDVGELHDGDELRTARAHVGCESSTNPDQHTHTKRRGRPKGVKDSMPRTRRTQDMIKIMSTKSRTRPSTLLRWASFPTGLLAKIFSFAACEAMLSCVCTSWRDVIRSKTLAVALKKDGLHRKDRDGERSMGPVAGTFDSLPGGGLVRKERSNGASLRRADGLDAFSERDGKQQQAKETMAQPEVPSSS
jgi:hypothetical protein